MSILTLNLDVQILNCWIMRSRCEILMIMQISNSNEQTIVNLNNEHQYNVISYENFDHKVKENISLYYRKWPRDKHTLRSQRNLLDFDRIFMPSSYMSPNSHPLQDLQVINALCEGSNKKTLPEARGSLSNNLQNS